MTETAEKPLVSDCCAVKSRYRTYDHLGSTRMVLSGTDAGFSVEEEMNYYAYGEQIPVLEPAVGARETFTGKEFDQEGEVESVTDGIDAYYFGYRMYDPAIGMWQATDPLPEFWNEYSYVGADPVNYVDPWGLQSYTVEIDKMKSISQVGIGPSIGPSQVVFGRVGGSGGGIGLIATGARSTLTPRYRGGFDPPTRRYRAAIDAATELRPIVETELTNAMYANTPPGATSVYLPPDDAVFTIIAGIIIFTPLDELLLAAIGGLIGAGLGIELGNVMESRGERNWGKAKGQDPFWDKSIEELKKIERNKNNSAEERARAQRIRKQKSKKKDPQSGKKK